MLAPTYLQDILGGQLFIPEGINTAQNRSTVHTTLLRIITTVVIAVFRRKCFAIGCPAWFQAWSLFFLHLL